MDEPERRFWRIMRRTGVELLVGTGAGFLLWQLIGVALLQLKYGSVGSSVTCAHDVQRALEDYVEGLRISALVGAVLGVIVAFVVRRWWRKRKAGKEIVKAKGDAKDQAKVAGAATASEE